MLCPEIIIPSPVMVSRDIKAIYMKMSKNVWNYFAVHFEFAQ